MFDIIHLQLDDIRRLHFKIYLREIFSDDGITCSMPGRSNCNIWLNSLYWQTKANLHAIVLQITTTESKLKTLIIIIIIIIIIVFIYVQSIDVCTSLFFFSVYPFHVVKSVLFHSRCYFLHPRISKTSLFSSSRRAPFQHFSR